LTDSGVTASRARTTPVQSSTPPAGAAETADLSALAALRQLQLGAESLAAGRTAEACLRLQQAVDGGARDATALFLLGVARLSAGELSAARAALGSAFELDPGDLAVATALARTAHLQGELHFAIATLQRVADHPRIEARTLALLGLLCLEVDRLDEAHSALLAAVSRDSDQVDGHRGLALLAERTGDFERAELAWRSALALRPDDVLLLAGLAAALHGQDRPAEALPCHETLVRLAPEDPRQHAHLAATLAELGRGAEARPVWERALALMPQAGEERAWVFFAYGVTLESRGDHLGAADAWQAALRDEPGLLVAHAALAELALDREEEDEARASLLVLFEAEFISAGHLLQLALLAERRGETELLERCAARLLDAPDDDPEVRFRRAQLHLLARDPELHDAPAALHLLQDLLTEGHGDRPALWDLLARALAEEGRHESVLAAVDRLLAESAPGSPAWQRYRDSRSRYLSALTER